MKYLNLALSSVATIVAILALLRVDDPAAPLPHTHAYGDITGAPWAHADHVHQYDQTDTVTFNTLSAASIQTHDFFHDGEALTPDNSICYLTYIGGALRGSNERARVKLNDSGQWQLEVVGPETQGAARCIVLL